MTDDSSRELTGAVNPKEPRPDQVRGELADGLNRYLSGKAMHDDGRVWLDISFPELMILREALRSPGVDDCGAATLLEQAVGIVQQYARISPKWTYDGQIQDPMGCHKWLSDYAALSQPNPGNGG